MYSPSRTWPAPPLIVIAILVLHVMPASQRLRVDVVVAVLLDVRVNDGHHLPALGGHLGDHVSRVGELLLVPGEVAVGVREGRGIGVNLLCTG